MARNESNLSGLSSRKKKLFDILLREQGVDFEDRIAPRKENKNIPLSFSQQRIWFMEQLHPWSNLYNIAATMLLTGPLNIPCLEKGLNEIVKRHEIFRTRFESVDGKPVQIISPSLEASLPVIDLRSYAQEICEREWKRLASEKCNEPFDLTRGPLFRADLLKTEEESHILVIAMHHIISDGWSFGIFLRELTAFYRSFYTKKPFHFSELPIQYADFAVWQRKKSKEDDMRGHLDYWKNQLHGIVPLEFPTDRPRPPVMIYEGLHLTFFLPLSLTDKIKALSQEQGVTLFVLLLAAFKVLLFRYTGQSDIVVGSPIANRNRSEIEDLIGCFINTLILRTELSGQMKFTELIEKVHEINLDAHAHQDIPFERLVAELDPERDLSRTPLFQIMFILQNVPMGKLDFPDLRVEPVEVENSTAKFDLTLSFEETEEGLAGWWEYNSHLFDTSTIRRMLDHLRILLESIVEDPQKRISDLDMLTSEERDRLLYEWNDTCRDYSPFRGIHEIFEEQVETSPDEIALIFEHTALTYRELNQRSNKLAHFLRKEGIRQDVPVALCCERSVEMVIGILGILKAGGAYVPLEPGYPKERLFYMLEDTKAPVVLTLEKHLPVFSHRTTPVICLDRDWPRIEQEEETNPPSIISPEDTAYIIYTSGSTGRPKGTMNTHRGIHNRLLWMQEKFQINREDQVLQKTPYSFDVSVWEIFWPLMTGARLVLAIPEGQKDSRYLVQSIIKHAITTLHFVPSMLQAFVEEESVEDCNRCLKRVICSGEALSFSLQERFFSKLDVDLHNLYGPTEAAIDVTAWKCKRNDPLRIVPIGRPVANTQIYILDANLQPVPVGVPGELYIGGTNLARGYLCRPERTAECFIPHPLRREVDARLYKTGDLARYLCDGSIEFLSRIDNQVKIRGYRIELGEIEAALLAHRHVQEAVVVAKERGEGDKILVAYIVVKPDHSVSVSAFHQFLKQKLPEYMMPASFIFLKALPLTANGKLDYKALPLPDSERPELGTGFVPPQNSTEEILVHIWSEVLKIDRIGIHDNFFELGGDSIVSIQLLSKAQQRGLQITLQQLFQNQTIHSLSNVIRNSEYSSCFDKEYKAFSMIPDEDREKMPEGIEDAYPISTIQYGMLFESELEQEESIYVNIGSFHLRAALNPELMQRSLKVLVLRHSILRTSFDITHFSKPLQLVHKEATIPLQVEDLQKLSFEEQERVIDRWMEECKKNRFDWSAAPLLRFCVYKRSDDSFQFCWKEHHAILDGWSEAAMMTELFDIYFSLLHKKEIPHTDFLKVDYSDFIALEQRAIESKEQQDYWIQKVKGRTFTRLPRFAQRLPGPGSGYPGEQYLALSKQICTGVKSIADKAGVSVKSVLFAAHLKVMSVLTNQSRVTTGLVYNGRPEKEDGDRLLGVFLNTMPFSMDLKSGSWLELIRRVFSEEVESLPYRRYPLIELQKAVGGSALFETAFLYTHFHVFRGVANREEFQLSGVKFFGRTNFPLTVIFNKDISSDEIGLVFWYDTREFSKEQIQSYAEYYRNSLNSIIADPMNDYGSFSVLSEQEHRQIIEGFNRTKQETRDVCIHTLFEEQVQKTPYLDALAFKDISLTYRELDERANRLACYLLKHGVKDDTPVALCMNRSVDMIVGVLGILKAGGVYMPLDPHYPKKRLSYMLNDARPHILLTQETLLDLLPIPGHMNSVICLDRDRSFIDDEPCEKVSKDISSENMAYILYTSGSTGRPKGVGMRHRPLSNLMQWQESIISLMEPLRTLQFSSLCFDVSNQEMFSTWSAGGTLILVDEDTRKDPVSLLKYIRDQHVERIFLPFVALESITHAAVKSGEAFTGSLKQIITAGEQLKLTAAIKEFLESNGSCELYNQYGPSESHVVTNHHVRRPFERADSLPPIGKPVSNARIYILDRYLNPVPVGSTGELYIGGDVLARGYINQSGLTRERFLPDNFDTSGSGRMYKTGDLARYLPDSTIEFLGREDHQVKIRGYRIELGEIESVLTEHPAVKECAVLADSENRESPVLIAYVACDSGDQTGTSEAKEKEWGSDSPEKKTEIRPEQCYADNSRDKKPSQELRRNLREALAQKLPEYMVPSKFVLLKVLPHTPNEKVDRLALQKLKPAHPETASPHFSLPQNAVELELQNIWQDVLNLDCIGIQDNFFDLGGHSLTAVRLMALVHEKFGKKLPLSLLFEAPTIEKLAKRLDHQTDPLLWSSLVAIQSKGKKAPLFFVPGAGGNVVGFYDLAHCLGSNRPFYGLQAKGLDGIQDPHRSVEEMAEHYVHQIKSVKKQGPYILGGHSFGSKVVYEMSQQLYALGDDVECLIILDTPATIIEQEPEGLNWDDTQWVVEMANRLDRFSDKKMSLSYESLKSLTADEQLQILKEKMVAAGFTHPEVGLSQLRGMINVVKASTQADYRPKVNSCVPVVLFRAEERSDSLFDADGDPQVAATLSTRDWGWKKYTCRGDVAVESVPGNHLSMLVKPHAELLVHKLQSYLNSVDRNNGRGVEQG